MSNAATQPVANAIRAALPTIEQIELIFGSHQAAHTYLTALRAAGAPITVDTCHYVRMAGLSGAGTAARADFTYKGGTRVLGL